ncbi:MAG: PAS domain-containing protein [Candidatus Zixiibacteriota bacterium]|nr:MAG: PAS domain-containing protein [candidate division Zixibacteria bacterium]
MQDELKDTSLCRVILDSIADGVFTVNADRQITSFNRAAERITGVPASRALKCKCYEVFQADICQSDCALEKTLKTGIGIQDLRAQILNSSGASVPVSISTAVLKDEAGRIRGAVESFHDLSTVERLRKELTRNYGFEDIISKSRVLNKMFTIIPDVAESESSVLIQGPFGSGRELLARVLHRMSPRRDQEWIQVNCGTLPPTLLEAEVFGYLKGAFPEARNSKPGKLAAAEKGTIYFNEIGEMPMSMQVKLQRLLRDGEYESLGASRAQKADVRVIASTNRDLKELVAQGRFRDDLYFRLVVVKLELPPLKERREDIPYLIDHFIHRFNARKGKNILGVSPEAMDLLMRYEFPGNIRELESLIEYGFAVCRGRVIEVGHLPNELQSFHSARLAAASALRYHDYPDEPTRIREVLRRHRGHLGHACRDLGFHRTTLWRKMKQYGIYRNEYTDSY